MCHILCFKAMAQHFFGNSGSMTLQSTPKSGHHHSSKVHMILYLVVKCLIIVLLLKWISFRCRCQMMDLTQQAKLCHLLPWMTAMSSKGEPEIENLFLPFNCCVKMFLDILSISHSITVRTRVSVFQKPRLEVRWATVLWKMRQYYLPQIHK